MLRVTALGLSVLLAASTAFAQVSATTGSINGTVKDNTGGVLPGVTVTASSPSMQGTRTDVTNASGEYRFPAVPPGTYRLVVELAGFGSVNREGVNVGLGFTATVNIELGVATLQETVTVSGESPVVDVSTTTTASNFGQERLAALPNARDFWTVLMAAPAVVVTRIDVGGSAAGTQTGYAVYDTKEDQHRPMVEGIVNTEGTNAAGFYYDYGSIDEVAVQTKGHTAEMPWPGVWSNFVAKSGGNEFHGKIYADYQNKSVQRENIPNDFTFLCPRGNCGNLTPSDLNRMERYYDLNGDVGGYVPGLRDKFWWYGSVRQQNIQVQVPNFPVKAFETGLRNISGKLTYALSQNNKLSAYAMWGLKHQPNRMDTFLIGATTARHSSEASTWEQRYWAHTYKLGYESVVGGSSFFEVRGGQFRYVWPNFRYSEDPAYADLGTSDVRGGNRDGWFNIPSRNQVAGSLHLLQGWLGRVAQLQGRRRVVPRDLHLRARPGRERHPAAGRAARAEQRPAHRGAAVPVAVAVGTGAAKRRALRPGYLASQLAADHQHRPTSRSVPSFLPEQEGPSGGRFSPATPSIFAEVDNVKTFNHPGAAHRPHLRRHRPGPHRGQGQLRPVLLESGHGHRRRRQPEQPGLLQPLHLDRPERQRRLRSGRSRAPSPPRSAVSAVARWTRT